VLLTLAIAQVRAASASSASDPLRSVTSA